MELIGVVHSDPMHLEPRALHPCSERANRGSRKGSELT